MPLKLNVGASRKVSDNNYGSRGASVNFELELDMALVKEPAKLQEKIRYLFGLVRTSLAEELNGHANGHGNGHVNGHANGHAAPSTNGVSQPMPVTENGNGYANGPRNNGHRPATASQVKALHAIARAHGVNLGQFLMEQFRVRRPDDLGIKQASQAIDELKSANVSGGSG